MMMHFKDSSSDTHIIITHKHSRPSFTTRPTIHTQTQQGDQLPPLCCHQDRGTGPATFSSAPDQAALTS